jgi:orotidine-5'-phosphate decarboxylase
MNRVELIREIFEKKSFLCVGLDSDLSKIPTHLLQEADPILAFNRAIIDATRDLCVAYKPNLAFYEALGPNGWHTLAQTIEYIGKKHLIIADAKRGDIGNTSKMYAEAFFQRLGCDAVTIAPYMGEDSVRPFLGFEGKWAILLALTSNAGSNDFQLAHQDHPNGEQLFEKVLRKACQWGTDEELMFVAGATQPTYFQQIRAIAPNYFLLVPGLGAQGGDLQAVWKYGATRDCGLLVNSARSIIYASQGTDFADAARLEASNIQQEMQQLLQQL